MSWMLVLIFMLSGQEPEYISVEAADGIACVEQAKTLKAAFIADVTMEGELHWVCSGPEGEIVTSEDEGS